MDEGNDAIQDLNTILQERARSLAQSQVGLEVESEGDETLLFELGQIVFGVRPSAIEEVAPVSQFTPIPLSPPYLSGLVNLRGAVMPCVDLGHLLELKSQVFDRRAGFVLGEGRDRLLFAVGKVVGLVKVSEEAVQPAPSGLHDSLAPMIRGITEDGVLLLEVEDLIQDPRLDFRPRGSWIGG